MGHGRTVQRVAQESPVDGESMGAGDDQGRRPRPRGAAQTGTDRKGAEIEGEGAPAQRPQGSANEAAAEEQEESRHENQTEEGRQEENIIESLLAFIFFFPGDPLRSQSLPAPPPLNTF